MEGLLSGNLLSKASVFGSSGGSNIKSIQRGTADMANASTLNIAISDVDLTKSIVIVSGVTSGVAGTYFWVQGKLLNSTTVSLRRNSVGTPAYLVDWVVIEFNNVKSLQTGETSVGNFLSVTQAVTSIDPLKSLLVHSWFTDYNDNFVTEAVWINKIESSTGISFRRAAYATAGNWYIRWYLIEFN